MQHDYEAIAQRHPIRELLESRYGVKFTGTKCHCPLGTHSDSDPSFNVFRRRNGLDGWKCHGCGKSGDVVDLVAALDNMDKGAAIKTLDGDKPPVRRPTPPSVEKRAYGPIPGDFAIPTVGRTFKYRDKSTGKVKETERPATHVHVYYALDGITRLGLTVRTDFQDRDGKPSKRIFPYRYFDGALYNEGWGKEEGFPIYGLECLKSNPGKPVCFVEGEKKVDMARNSGLTDYVWLAWQSGAPNAANVNYEDIAGRAVVGWPDNDEAGFNAMKAMADKAKDIAQSVAIIVPDPAWPAKHDIVNVLDDYARSGKAAREVQTWMALPENFKYAKRPENKNIVNLRQIALDENPEWMKAFEWTRNKEGGVSSRDEANAWRYMNNAPSVKDQFQYDEFDRVVLFRGETFGPKDAYDLASEIQASPPHLQPKANQILDMAAQLAASHSQSRFRDFLLDLPPKWDGVKRVEPGQGNGLLPDYANVLPTPFAKIIGMRWMIGLVGRVIDPGLQHDGILVLEGAEGLRKTSFFRRLGQIADRSLHINFSASSLGKDKDELMRFAGRAIVEMGEMAAHRKAEQDAFKDFTTLLEDVYRPPYAREPRAFKRSYIFCGTTNDRSAYLTDPNANRRIWPVEVVSRIAVERLTDEVLIQIWAEAVKLYRDSERNWLEGEEMLWHREAIDARREHDPWVQTIADTMQSQKWPAEGPIPEGLIWNALNITTDKRTPALKKRITRIMEAPPFNMTERRGAPGSENRALAFRRDKRRRD